MKKQFLILSCILLFFSCSESVETNEGKNYNDEFLKYLTIVEVIDELLDYYQIEENSEGRKLLNQFQKPDGWHVVTMKYNFDEKKYDIILDEIFWDLEKEEFNKIDYPENESAAIL